MLFPKPTVTPRSPHDLKVTKTKLQEMLGKAKNRFKRSKIHELEQWNVKPAAMYRTVREFNKAGKLGLGLPYGKNSTIFHKNSQENLKKKSSRAALGLTNAERRRMILKQFLNVEKKTNKFSRKFPTLTNSRPDYTRGGKMTCHNVGSKPGFSRNVRGAPYAN